MNGFDNWMLDLLELNDNIYLEFDIGIKYYIALFYCPANHRMFLSPQDNKLSETCLESYDNFKEFV